MVHVAIPGHTRVHSAAKKERVDMLSSAVAHLFCYLLACGGQGFVSVCGGVMLREGALYFLVLQQEAPELHSLFGLSADDELMEAFQCSLAQTYKCLHNTFSDAREARLFTTATLHKYNLMQPRNWCKRAVFSGTLTRLLLLLCMCPAAPGHLPGHAVRHGQARLLCRARRRAHQVHHPLQGHH